MKLFLLITLLAGFSHGAETSVAPGVAASTSIFDLDELDAPVQLIEAEFDPALLENLPPPTTGSLQVSLPRMIVEKGQWRGSLCGIARPARAVFRKPETWDKFWKLAILPYSPGLRNVPNVDFSKDMVVSVFRGEEPSPGFQIEIESIKVADEGGQTLVKVRYRNTQQMKAIFNPPFNVQPFHLMKTPLSTGRVVFVNTEK